MCYCSLYLCSGLNVDGLKHLENRNQNTLLIPEENKFSCPLVGLQWRFDLNASPWESIMNCITVIKVLISMYGLDNPQLLSKVTTSAGYGFISTERQGIRNHPEDRREEEGGQGLFW